MRNSMRWTVMVLVLVTLAVASPLQAQERPWVRDAGRLREYYGVIDTLVQLTGAKPAELRVVSGLSLADGNMRMTRKGWVLTVGSRSMRERFTLLHEWGHFVNAVNGPLFYMYLDSLNLNDAFNEDRTGRIYERFADDFAWAYEAWANGFVSQRPGSAWLQSRFPARGTQLATIE